MTNEKVNQSKASKKERSKAVGAVEASAAKNSEKSKNDQAQGQKSKNDQETAQNLDAK